MSDRLAEARRAIEGLFREEMDAGARTSYLVVESLSRRVLAIIDSLAPAGLDVERLARALNESVGSVGWLHLTPPSPVEEWRENARIIAAEYARLTAESEEPG